METGSIVVSDCVIDLVSSGSLKQYMHCHFQDLVDEKYYHRTGKDAAFLTMKINVVTKFIKIQNLKTVRAASRFCEI